MEMMKQKVREGRKRLQDGSGMTVTLINED
jgi:hypothetical protein